MLCKLTDLRSCIFDCACRFFRSDGESFRRDDCDVGDTEEREDIFDVARLVIVGLERGAGAVESAACGNDDRSFLTAKPHWPSRRVPEGFAGDADQIDPGLELTGNTEVLHRNVYDDDISSEKLLEDCFTDCELCLLLRSVGIALRAVDTKYCSVVAEWILDEVAIYEFSVRMHA